jgi:ParB family transcriptional regulator, chromosome partitioning protein
MQLDDGAMSTQNGDGPGKPKPRLGRGLSALMGPTGRESAIEPGAKRAEGVRVVQVADIRPHPDQPRRHFDEAALDELAASIKERGVLQPIVVRQTDSGFQIVAGERRWRAAQRAQLHEMPVIVRELTEAQTLEIAIIENIQREDLNVIEEAEAYRRLILEFGHTQEVLGQIVHKSRSHIANLLRLLDLPDAVRAQVAEGLLSMGHARALITAEHPERLAAEVIKRGFSVRETERLARATRQGAQRPRGAAMIDDNVRVLQERLAAALGCSVEIVPQGSGGTVKLEYTSLDQLDLICQRLSGEKI